MQWGIVFLLQMQLGLLEQVMPTTSFLTKFASFIQPIGHKILISTMVKKRYGHCAIALASQEVLQCLHSKTMLTVKADEFLMIFNPYWDAVPVFQFHQLNANVGLVKWT